MTAHWTRRQWIEIGYRALAAIGLGIFVWRAGYYFLSTGRPVYLLLAIAESLTVTFAVFSRTPQIRSLRPLDVLATMGATYYFLLIQMEGGRELLHAPWPALLQLSGITLEILSKWTLGRSFGLLPAHRGVVVRGVYQMVRHPIYLSYMLTHVGYLLAVFSWHNLLLFVLLYTLQVIRILREEALLSADPAYRAYMHKVRWRLIPLVF